MTGPLVLQKRCTIVQECAVFYYLPFLGLFNSHFPGKAG